MAWVVSKRITLGSIYMAAELYMLTDYSPDFSDTRDFIKRQIADAESAGSTAGFAMKHVRPTDRTLYYCSFPAHKL